MGQCSFLAFNSLNQTLLTGFMSHAEVSQCVFELSAHAQYCGHAFSPSEISAFFFFFLFAGFIFLNHKG